MISKERALNLWKLEMADKEYAYDFSGKKIKKSDLLNGRKEKCDKNPLYILHKKIKINSLIF